ncbi:MAG: hypothetical protein ACYSUQ_15965, partial [Planctomycetota bacterium]|jgi:hypothetical protein
MSRFEKWLVWISASATAVTGAGLFWAKYLLQTDDPWAVVNHPLQPWFLKAHIIVSPLLIFAVGLIAARHIWEHYRAGLLAGRRSGIVTVLAAAPMFVTGYLIQAITHAGWLEAMAISHIALGFLFTLGLAAHQVFVRRRARIARMVRAPRAAGREPGGHSRPAVAATPMDSTQ